MDQFPSKCRRLSFILLFNLCTGICFANEVDIPRTEALRDQSNIVASLEVVFLAPLPVAMAALDGTVDPATDTVTLPTGYAWRFEQGKLMHPVVSQVTGRNVSCFFHVINMLESKPPTLPSGAFLFSNPKVQQLSQSTAQLESLKFSYGKKNKFHAELFCNRPGGAKAITLAELNETVGGRYVSFKRSP